MLKSFLFTERCFWNSDLSPVSAGIATGMESNVNIPGVVFEIGSCVLREELARGAFTGARYLPRAYCALPADIFDREIGRPFVDRRAEPSCEEKRLRLIGWS